jgi:hypothetical protein
MELDCIKSLNYGLVTSLRTGVSYIVMIRSVTEEVNGSLMQKSDVMHIFLIFSKILGQILDDLHCYVGRRSR